MRAYKDDPTPRTTLDYIECDKCKARHPGGTSFADVCAYDDRDDPDTELYDWTFFDLCKRCYFNWLVPLLAEHGVQPSYDIHSATGARIER